MPRRSVRIPPLPEHIVESPTDLEACLLHLHTAPAIGLDTEFIGEETYRPDLCLIQVSTPERLFLIDPLASGPLDRFWDWLQNPEQVVVVHAGREEVRMCYFAGGAPPTNLFDVQIAAALIGKPYPIGYGNLVLDLFSVETRKSETLTDWSQRPLTTAQIRYAYDDVRYLLPAWQQIKKRLAALGRLSWADEEFTTFVRWATEQEPSLERWRKIKGLGRLKRRELAVVRELYHWRDSLAKRLNRPARYLMRDDLLLELARRGARRQFDLSAVRGLPRGESSAILEIMRAAAELPLAQCPVVESAEADPPQVATLASLLNIVLADIGTRLELAPNFVATSQDLKDLVRSHLPGRSLPPDSPFASGWRTEYIRPELERVLSGQRVVKVSSVLLEAPLSFPAELKANSPDAPT